MSPHGLGAPLATTPSRRGHQRSDRHHTTPTPTQRTAGQAHDPHNQPPDTRPDANSTLLDRAGADRLRSTDAAGTRGSGRVFGLGGCETLRMAFRCKGFWALAGGLWGPKPSISSPLPSHPPQTPIATYFVSRYSPIPSNPPSRPNPDCFTPPNGAAGFDTTPWLTPPSPFRSPRTPGTRGRGRACKRMRRARTPCGWRRRAPPHRS